MDNKPTKGLYKREDKVGFLRAANPKFSTATAIAGMFSDSSFKGIEEALKLIGDGIRSGDNAHNQQVNIGDIQDPSTEIIDAAEDPVILEKNETDELFGGLGNGQQLDTGKTRESSEGDHALETVGAVNGAENRARKSNIGSK